MKKIIYLIAILTLYFKSLVIAQHDLTVIGLGIYTEALGRLSITTIDMLKDDVKLNYIPSLNAVFPDFVAPEIWNIMIHPDKSYGNVSLIYQPDENILKTCNSKIKILYTMIDSPAVNPGDFNGLNEYFDLMVVPDEWLVDVYRKGGVKIPIFVLPCPIYLGEFFSQPPKYHDKHNFVFGSSGCFVPRKNHITVLEAFIQEFGNNPYVKLKLHGRWGSEDSTLRERINQIGINNVEIINQTITQQDFIKFMTSLDCYVFLSKGEGYSITPRESLACGIPCILSNNTAHKNLCDSGFVTAVPSEILECGFYNCLVDDARNAMRNVYDNYQESLKIAARAKDWVKKYDQHQLKHLYLSLIKPKKIVLGKINKIEEEQLITNSEELYQKYCQLIEN